MMTRASSTSALLAAALVAICAASGLGCKDYVEDRCELICDCQECNEEQEETCMLETEAALDVADAYECSDQMEAYLDCETEKYRCFEQSYQIGGACRPEQDELFSCMDDTSKRTGGAFSPPSVSRP